jgi:Ca2+-binding EF-hand superfamily protein
MFQYAENAYN